MDPAFAELPDRCFAYVPKDGSRKLRLCNREGEIDAAMVGAAAQAMSETYRGTRVTIPDADKTKVLGRIRSAWKRANPDADDAEMPVALRATEVVRASEEVSDDPEPGPTKDYLSAFKGFLKSLKGVSITDEDFDALHRRAMGSAGGRSTARKRAAKALTASEAHDHSQVHGVPMAGCETCSGMYGGSIQKMPKADDRVSYREAADPAKPPRCYDCRFYQWGGCALVEGAIEADDLCDLYLPPIQTYPGQDATTGPMVASATIYEAANKDGGGWNLFTELPQTFGEAPDWVQVLPLPGKYAHPKYGQMVISPERNARFVENFNARVYQQDLPITLNVEHNGQMSGAVGKIETLRQNADGSVDGKIQWSQRGVQLIEGEQFNYFSPEWHEVWTDPATEQVYTDVLIGGALCVRPFFKESALRPLVASEGGLATIEGWDDDRTGVGVMVPLKKAATEERLMVVELTEAEVEKLRADSAEVETLKQQLQTFSEAKATADEQIQALRRESQERKFTDVVKGRGQGENGGDGPAWVGETQANVASLMRFAEAFGEDSEEFKAEVDHRNTIAATFANTRQFSAVGSSEPGDVGKTEPVSGEDTPATVKAKELIKADPKLSMDDAMTRVFTENPGLYREHRRASRYVGSLDRE